ncbi:MAG: recombination regulator RecX [Gaiellaceae bacterium MAG52_C11]|nr:recombination regulator RecX [Candidatus Gaiellasilicea maunaloa]
MTEPRTAVETALRALRARDRSAAELESRLRGRGVDETEQRETLELLSRLGYVDDERFATLRAAALAARSCGDELIRDDLERRGVAGSTIDAALAELEPQQERADRIVANRGRSAKTARFLAARGFAEDVIEGAFAWEDAEGIG